jgi:hypothetical protein
MKIEYRIILMWYLAQVRLAWIMVIFGLLDYDSFWNLKEYMLEKMEVNK